jgi:succinate dehydrogenase/fumarate reductase flavoprotein subunit
MNARNHIPDNVIETEVLVLGSGAAGCGAAMAAKEEGARCTLLDKGKLESSGCLGGGNDHFMAVLDSGPETDTAEALAKFYQKPMTGFTARMIEDGWAKMMPTILRILEEAGVEFVKKPDGSPVRTVGFGQPGEWWIHIKNGHLVKRLLARKVRQLGIDVIDHVMITKLIKNGDRIVGCLGYDVRNGIFYIFKAKKVVLALGNTASRGWTNSTGNPYNAWFYPYNTGAQFVLAYDVGAKIFNLDVQQLATLIPKGFGAPGMNGINSMGGYELNGLSERFMGKYDPMWENGLRINQVSGAYQEQIEGRGPPFYLDMRHLDKEEVHYLQYVLMPGDKATYLDYCRQKGIEFSRDLLEVEISELGAGGAVIAVESFETNVRGLYNGCLFFALSGAICGGYYAGMQAAKASCRDPWPGAINEDVITEEKERVFRPLEVKKGVSYREFEGVIRQVMNYYMGYRRNQKGMETTLAKLDYIATWLDRIEAQNYHELMRAHESAEVLRMCRLTTKASMERKESGRGYYRRSDYPDLNPDLNKPLVLWQEDGEERFSWGL